MSLKPEGEQISVELVANRESTTGEYKLPILLIDEKKAAAIAEKLGLILARGGEIKYLTADPDSPPRLIKKW